MSTQVTEPIVEAPPEDPTSLGRSDAERTVSQLFRYSQYVHVGLGAEACEHGENGRCTDTIHFHAWIRLPNQFQHEDIQRKARAARARAMRALRDPESDRYLILEDELDQVRQGDREATIDGLVSVSDLDDRIAVMREVEAEEEYANRMADWERQVEIQAMPEDEQPSDELAELVRQTERYQAEVEERLVRLREPRRRAFAGMDLETLVGQVRDQRITELGVAAFTSAYARYEWYVCTLRPVAQGRPQERVFKEMRDLDDAAPEVINALRIAFHGLETSLQRGVGNW